MNEEIDESILEDNLEKIELLTQENESKLSKLGFLVRDTLMKSFRKTKEGISDKEMNESYTTIQLIRDTAKEIAYNNFQIEELEAGPQKYNIETKRMESPVIKHKYNQFYNPIFEKADPKLVAEKRSRYEKFILAAATRGRVAKRGTLGKKGLRSSTYELENQLLELNEIHEANQKEKKIEIEKEKIFHKEFHTQMSSRQSFYNNKKEILTFRNKKSDATIALFEKRLKTFGVNEKSFYEMKEKYKVFGKDYFSDSVRLLLFSGDKAGLIKEINKFSERIVDQETNETTINYKKHMYEILSLEEKLSKDKPKKHILARGITSATLKNLKKKYNLSFTHLEYQGERVGYNPILRSKYFGFNPDITRDPEQCIRLLIARSTNDRKDLDEIHNTSSTEAKKNHTKNMQASTFIEATLPEKEMKRGIVKIGNPSIRKKRRMQQTAGSARSEEKMGKNRSYINKLDGKTRINISIDEFYEAMPSIFPDGTYSEANYKKRYEDIPKNEKKHRPKNPVYLSSIFDIHTAYAENNSEIMQAIIENDTNKMNIEVERARTFIKDSSEIPDNIKKMLVLCNLLNKPNNELHMTTDDLSLKVKGKTISGGLSNRLEEHGEKVQQKYGILPPKSPQTIWLRCVGSVYESLNPEELKNALLKRREEVISSGRIKKEELKFILRPNGIKLID